MCESPRATGPYATGSYALFTRHPSRAAPPRPALVASLVCRRSVQRPVLTRFEMDLAPCLYCCILPQHLLRDILQPLKRECKRCIMFTVTSAQCADCKYASRAVWTRSLKCADCALEQTHYRQKYQVVKSRYLLSTPVQSGVSYSFAEQREMCFVLR